MADKERFWLGEIIKTIELDMDGEDLVIIKYHPRIVDGVTVTKSINKDEVLYSVECMSHSFGNMHKAVIAWIAYKRLGLNQNPLVSGISKALECEE